MRRQLPDRTTSGMREGSPPREPMRLLICGGRDFGDEWLFGRALDHFAREPVVIIHGGARGADAMADAWARRHRKEVLAFPADWAKHGRAAGPIRNARMLAEGKPHCVIALPGGKGTADMVRRAVEAGLGVIDYNAPSFIPSAKKTAA